MNVEVGGAPHWSCGIGESGQTRPRQKWLSSFSLTDQHRGYPTWVKTHHSAILRDGVEEGRVEEEEEALSDETEKKALPHVVPA